MKLTYKNSQTSPRPGQIRFIRYFVFALFLTSLSGCDQFNEVDGLVDELQEIQKVRTFEVKLHALNQSGVTGKVILHYLKDGNFQVQVNAKNLAPNMVHPQHIHGLGFASDEPENAVCPPEDAAGEDGLLTLVDGLPFYGGVLIPLDDEVYPVTTQTFPMANGNGQLNYLEFTNLNSLVQSIDENFDGHQTAEYLDFEDRVVVLHGAFVKDNMVVDPDTEGAEYMITLPVACGEFVEIF